jgi:hypothetical protein
VQIEPPALLVGQRQGCPGEIGDQGELPLGDPNLHWDI